MIRLLRGHRTRSAPAIHPTERDAPMPLTSTEGRTHLIGADDLDHALATHSGTYRALCRRHVLAASLSAPPGRPCPDCHVIPDHSTDRSTDPDRSSTRATCSRTRATSVGG